MAPALTLRELRTARLFVYRPGAELLRNITTVYSASVWRLLKSNTPRHIDMANPLVDYFLGTGWSPRRARVSLDDEASNVAIGATGNRFGPFVCHRHLSRGVM